MTLRDLVHVIDDDIAVRRSLAFLLAADGHLVRLYESASDFLSTSQDLSAGCIIADLRMPGIDGIELLRRLASRKHTTPVIIVTGHADIKLAVYAMRLGAYDFLEKPYEDTRLLAAVRAALSSDFVAGRQSLAGARADTEVHPIDKTFQQRLRDLTPRELEVLNALMTGDTNKMVGLKLGISPRTVEIHRAKVMTKMGAASLPHLIRMSLKNEVS